MAGTTPQRGAAMPSAETVAKGRNSYVKVTHDDGLNRAGFGGGYCFKLISISLRAPSA